MLKNYFVTAFRNLARQKIYTAINVIGLATGIASCLMIVMFVVFELSYDRFHSKADRIYRMTLERKYPTHSTFYAVIPHSFSDVLSTDFPEVDQVVKVGGPYNNNDVVYRNERGEEKVFEENFVLAADSNFFSVFDFKIIKGNPENPFGKTTDMVITASTALRYFNDGEALGKVLQIFGNSYTVSAVCQDVPENTHLKFDFLLHWNAPFFGPGENFTGFNAHTYILMKPGQDAMALEAKFPKMVDTYAAAQIENNLGKSWADYKKEGNGYRYFLQALPDIHLDPLNIEAKIKAGGNRNYIYFLSCIAILVVVIACINFINLSTTRSTERAREVGVRKSLGSKKQQLVNQFLIESLLISLLATLLSLLIIYGALPWFNDLTGKELKIEFTIPIVFGLTGVTLIVGLVAGTYPAFVLSSFNPVAVLKGNSASKNHGSWPRNALVVFQFFVSIILIAGTITVGRQMTYMQHKALGFDKNQIIVVERILSIPNRGYQTFLDEVKRIPRVQGTAGSLAILGGSKTVDYFGESWGLEGSSEIHTSKTLTIDDDFTSTVGLKVIEGRSFSRATEDSLSILLNETAVRVFGINDPVGKKLRQTNGNVVTEFTIIGVIEDFNFQSLHDHITPLTIRSTESLGFGSAYAYVKIESENLPATLSSIEDKWKQMAPGQPFKYFFLDQQIDQQYRSERQAGDVFKIFSVLAIIIACVGLFGLAAYTAHLRTKEIGVRKVLGASVSGVVILLSKDFTRLILIAFVLATPLGWLLMEEWLAGFAYRINVGPDIFIFAGLTALAIGWLTVSYQSIKAAVVNPVKALRNE